MNWDAIGAIGEIVGAAGVIITLLYLAIQLRQNTKASKLTAIQNSMENSARFSELLATDADLARVFWVGLSDPDALDPEQKRKFVSTLNVFMRRESVAFYLHKEGTMPESLWSARVKAFTGALNQPGLRMYLDSSAESLPKDFRDFVEVLIEKESTMTDELRALLAHEEHTA